MDCSLEHFKLLHCIQKIPLWIIVEYAWTHKMIDILEAVAADKELSLWPEVDLEFMTLEEPWRLRVASAQAYSIMRRRDICQFEKVVALLEATHRLVPRLVSPIKHMKIMFGLKTMIVMWMLKNNKGIVDTVVKIIQYFPSKLPQYHNQCSYHDMYLMRKNHQDFKTLAQTLAMDKNKLQNYITEQMDEQYGECYAHKLEERLLCYLQELEAVLPSQTYIDELLKEERPRTEEERLLLEMITFDDTPLSTSLKRLLHCVLASSSPGRVSQKADQVAVKCVSSSKDAQRARPSEVILVPVERRALVEVKPQELRTMENVAQHLSEDSPLLLEDEEDEDSVEEGRSQQRTTDKEGENVVEGQAMEMAKSKSSGASDVDERAGTREEEDGEREMQVEGDYDKENDNSERSDDSALENVPFPRFWCKHHQWVKSILHECSDVQPEQLQVQHDVTTSPTTLFKLSSSTSSSQDFTVTVKCVSSSKDAQRARPSEVILVPVERRALVEVKPQELRTMENVAQHLSEDSPLLLEDEEDEDSVEEGRSQQRTTDKEGENVVEGQAMEMAKSKSSGASDVDERAGTREEEDGEREMQVEGDDDKENDNSERSDDSALENVPFPRFWCKHHQWVKSILHECSDVQPEQLQVQHDVTTSPTTLFKLSSSTSSSQDFTVTVKCVSSSKDAQRARPSEVILVPVERRALVEVKPQELRTMENVAQHLSEDSPLLLEDEEDEDSVEEGRSQQRTTDKEGENVVEGQAMEMAKSKSSGASDVDERAGTREEEDGEREMQVEGDDDKENDNSERSDDSALENVPFPRFWFPRFWCKHHQWVKSILHECSDVQPEQLQVQHDVTTSPTTLFKLSSSTSSSQDFTPSPLFSCPLIQSHPDSSTSSSQDVTPSLLFSCPLVHSHSASQTSTPLETTQDSQKTAPTDKGLVKGLVGLVPTVLQTEPALQLSSRDSEVVTLLSPVHPLKYSTASNIDIPAFQPQIHLQLSPPHVTTSRQQHALPCLPEPVVSPYSHTLSNKDGIMSQNVFSTSTSTSTGWPAPTRRPLSRLSRRFHRNHVTTSRQQHALSYPPELVAFPYSYTLSLSNKDSNMSQNASTSTGCMSPPQRPLSRLSRRFQQNCSVVCRSQGSTPFNHIPEQSGTHRQMTASAPNLQSWTLSDQVPLSSKPSSEQAIHSQSVAVPQPSNYVLPSPCVQWDLNTRHNTHQAQTLPCPSTTSQSISQIHCQADRTQVRMSPQCQSMLLQSKLLQPLLTLTRLSQQELIGVTEGRSLTQEEVGNNENEELEVGDGQQDLTDTSFNINSLYSSDESFDRDNEDSHDSDPDYIPQEKKQRVQL